MKKITLVTLFLSLNLLFGEDVYAIFNVEAIQDSNLKVDAGGVVGEIYVNVGSHVKKGDRLLVLSNRDKLESIEMQKASMISMEQQYNFAKIQYERYEQTSDVVDKNTLDQIFFNFKKLESDLNQAKHNLSYQQEMYNKTFLKAPFNGVIAEKNIEAGDGVAANTTNVFRLISHNRKIVLEFDSKYFNVVKVGDEYHYNIDGAGKKMVAKITKIYPSVDANNRKVKAEAIVEGLAPGIFGDGYIRIK